MLEAKLLYKENSRIHIQDMQEEDPFYEVLSMKEDLKIEKKDELNLIDMARFIDNQEENKAQRK